MASSSNNNNNSENNSTRAFAKMLSQESYYPASPSSLFLPNKPNSPLSSSTSKNHLSQQLSLFIDKSAASAASNTHLKPANIDTKQSQKINQNSNNVSIKLQPHHNPSSSFGAAAAALPHLSSSASKKMTQTLKQLDSFAPTSSTSTANFGKVKAYSSFVEKVPAEIDPSFKANQQLQQYNNIVPANELQQQMMQLKHSHFQQFQSTPSTSNKQQDLSNTANKLTAAAVTTTTAQPGTTFVFDKLKARNKKQHTSSIPSKFFIETPSIPPQQQQEISLRNNLSSSYFHQIAQNPQLTMSSSVVVLPQHHQLSTPGASGIPNKQDEDRIQSHKHPLTNKQPSSKTAKNSTTTTTKKPAVAKLNNFTSQLFLLNYDTLPSSKDIPTTNHTALQQEQPTNQQFADNLINNQSYLQKKKHRKVASMNAGKTMKDSGMFVDFSKNLYNIDLDFKNAIKAQSLSSVISALHSNKHPLTSHYPQQQPNSPLRMISSAIAAEKQQNQQNNRNTQTSSCNNSRTIAAVSKNYLVEPNEEHHQLQCEQQSVAKSLVKHLQQDNNKYKSSLAKITQAKQQSNPLNTSNADVSRLNKAFEGILKTPIDLNSYPSIMEVFSEVIQADSIFTSSLQKFKMCMDSLMHSVGHKVEGLGKSEDSRALSYSTNITSPQNSKTPCDVTSTTRDYSTKKQPLVRTLFDKQTQTTISGETQLEAGDAELDSSMLKEFVIEQEKQIGAYKQKEATMIKLLVAIKKAGIDIDTIYERDVLEVNCNKEKQNQQRYDQDEEANNDAAVAGDYSHEHNNVVSRSKFIENMRNGIVDTFKNSPSFAGFADESIINDSDESSFNFYGKLDQNSSDFSDEEQQTPQNNNNVKHFNSNNQKVSQSITSTSKKQLFKINLTELKKEDTFQEQQQQQQCTAPNKQLQIQQQQHQQNKNGVIYIEQQDCGGNDETDIVGRGGVITPLILQDLDL